MKKSKAENAVEAINIELDSDKQTIEVPITLAFKYKTNSSPLYAKVISWWTKSPYYHIETILFNKYWVSASWNEDVYIRKLEPLRDSWDYVDLKPVKVSKQQLKGIVEYINKQNHTKYDKLGIFLSQVIKLNINDDKNWICSELAVKIMELLGVKKFFCQTACKFSPADIFRMLEQDINNLKAGNTDTELVESAYLCSTNTELKAQSKAISALYKELDKSILEKAKEEDKK